MPDFGIIVMGFGGLAVVFFSLVLAYCSVVDGAPRTPKD